MTSSEAIFSVWAIEGKASKIEEMSNVGICGIHCKTRSFVTGVKKTGFLAIQPQALADWLNYKIMCEARALKFGSDYLRFGLVYMPSSISLSIAPR